MKFFIILTISLFSIIACDSKNKTAEQYYQEQDYVQALKLFKPRANSGDAVAQNYVGMIYYLGLTEDRNISKATVWFEKAAKQKNASGQLNYAMVLEAQATEADEFLECYKWYFAAHENGSKEAEKRIKHLLKQHRIFHNQRAYAQKQMAPYINYKQD